MKKGIVVFLSVLLVGVIALFGVNHFYGNFLNMNLKKFNKEEKVFDDTSFKYDVRLCFLPTGSEKKVAEFGVDENFIQFEYYANTNKTIFSSADCPSGNPYNNTVYDCFLIVDGNLINKFDALLSFGDDYIDSYFKAYNPDTYSCPPSYSDYRLSTLFQNGSYKLLTSEHFLNYWCTYDIPKSENSMGYIEFWDYNLSNNSDEYFRKYYKGEKVFFLDLSFSYNGKIYNQLFSFSLDSEFIASHNFS